MTIARGGGCCLCCTTRVGLRTAGDLDVGGDEEKPELEVVDGETEEEPVPGLGAIGIATSTVRLYAGYPSHCLPDRTHLLHCGLVSSHFTLRFLVKIGEHMRRGTRHWRSLQKMKHQSIAADSLAIITTRLDLRTTCSPRLLSVRLGGGGSWIHLALGTFLYIARSQSTPRRTVVGGM